VWALAVRHRASAHVQAGHEVVARGGLAPDPDMGNDRATPTEDARVRDVITEDPRAAAWAVVVLVVIVLVT
jgi:hypothetical protein